MVAVPIPRTGQPTQIRSLASGSPAKQDWTDLVAAAVIVAGGALIVSGHKKAGIAAAAAGTALALLDEPDLIESWWKSLPAYLADAQGFLDKVEGYMQDVSDQGHRIQSILRR
jgi:hypothetical protein